MFFKLNSNKTPFGLVFIIAFLPVYLLYLVIKMVLKLIVNIAKCFVTSIHRLMIMDLQICGYHMENDD